MPRRKSQSDEQVLDAALALLREGGVEGLTFAALAARSGLSAATLVQRFGAKPELGRRALLQAWDQLDDLTAELAATVPRTAAGAVEFLVGLSRGHERPDYEGSGLLLLREDLRDPVLRERGVAWESALVEALDDCFSSTPDAPDQIGRVLASQWQGALIWWLFRRSVPLEEYLTDSITEIVGLLVPSERRARA
ncbi:TetR/AcrR family transcriptional regulator [Pseudonocardia abyssalis]|uniref:TetR/AcrR family transcriptional regulator n=1 Tax=Pseudonocardia abyssalis TaxID=2792008 RepID=A0ABS6UYW5_9PSEU|nr:helix-turn-helix domain-containing protein [Pseudonocardia abyssalis]MBW0115739.1 TetR/AcrR family transcriptional regulator [Pseudonocardia abyssalis]MBW0137412.1 TetR/AcrR family transcriptional regulator [Pseudonocardia abyssalis]